MATNISGKKKTKVILKIAKNFLAYHPQKGKPTNFEMKIKAKDKIHTIRPNYEAWKKKIEKVKNGESELIVEQWSGLPYRSSPELLFKYDDKDDIDVSKLTFEEGKGLIVNDEVIVPTEILAKNDGLTLQEFEDWFKIFPPEPFAIIHFTGFRYKADKFDTI